MTLAKGETRRRVRFRQKTRSTGGHMATLKWSRRATTMMMVDVMMKKNDDDNNNKDK